MALIVSAGDVYLGSPFTTDVEALGTTIGALDGEAVPDRGRYLTYALTLTPARATLNQASMASSDVVPISDGCRARRAQAARDALRADGARLSTLLVAPGSAPSGVLRADAAALDALAARGGQGGRGGAPTGSCSECCRRRAVRPRGRRHAAPDASRPWPAPACLAGSANAAHPPCAARGARRGGGAGRRPRGAREIALQAGPWRRGDRGSLRWPRGLRRPLHRYRDLVERLRTGARPSEPEPSTFYGIGPEGCTGDPALEHAS